MLPCCYLKMRAKALPSIRSILMMIKAKRLHSSSQPGLGEVLPVDLMILSFINLSIPDLKLSKWQRLHLICFHQKQNRIHE